MASCVSWFRTGCFHDDKFLSDSLSGNDSHSLRSALYQGRRLVESVFEFQIQIELDIKLLVELENDVFEIDIILMDAVVHAQVQVKKEIELNLEQDESNHQELVG